MKFNLALLGGLAALCSTLPVQAQYTKGWSPGQPVVKSNLKAAAKGWAPGQPKYRPATPPSAEVPVEAPPVAESTADASDLTSALLSFDINNVLLAGAKKLGLNVSVPSTEKKFWDERIPLITDDNFNDFFNEQFASEDEAAARTWAIVMCVCFLSVRMVPRSD